MKEKTRLRIIGMMTENPNGFTVAGICDELDMQERAIIKALDSLIADGWIERHRNENCIAFGKAVYFYRMRRETE